MPIANALLAGGGRGNGKRGQRNQYEQVASGGRQRGNRQHIVANSFFSFLRALAAVADFFLFAVID